MLADKNAIYIWTHLCVGARTYAYVSKLRDIMSLKKIYSESKREFTEQTSSVYCFKTLYIFLLKQNLNKNQSFYKHSKNCNLIHA